MPRPKPTDDDLKEREERSTQIRLFLKNFKFTEVKLAEILGISRRSVQMMKAGRVSPHHDTIKAWESLRAKYQRVGR